MKPGHLLQVPSPGKSTNLVNFGYKPVYWDRKTHLWKGWQPLTRLSTSGRRQTGANMCVLMWGNQRWLCWWSKPLWSLNSPAYGLQFAPFQYPRAQDSILHLNPRAMLPSAMIIYKHSCISRCHLELEPNLKLNYFKKIFTT